MSEDRFNLSEEYAGLGQQVIDAADTAWAEVARIDEQLAALDKLGELSIAGVTVEDDAREKLEDRKARTQSDAAVLGAMAVRVQPTYVVGESLNGDGPSARPASGEDNDLLPVAGSGSSGSGDPEGQVKRLQFKTEKSREKFQTGALAALGFVAGRGGLVEREGGTSAGTIVRKGASLTHSDWNNLNIRLRQEGILDVEKDAETGRLVSIRIERQRALELIEVGDLPADLAQPIQKLEEPTGPRANGGNPDFLD